MNSLVVASKLRPQGRLSVTLSRTLLERSNSTALQQCGRDDLKALAVLACVMCPRGKNARVLQKHVVYADSLSAAFQTWPHAGHVG